MFELHQKTAFVTGAASGIGLAVCRLFVQQGAQVIAFDRDADALARLSGESGITGQHGDVADEESVRRAMNRAVERFGKLDILINNAGIAHVGSLLATDEDAFLRVFQVNVQGVYVCCRQAVRLMQAAGGGVIVNLASIASLVGLEDRFAYSMSKGAVLSMTRSIAADYMKDSIRCNCVCPARIHTPFVDRFITENYPGEESRMFERLSKSQPMGRMGTADEVAQLVLYLSSDEAAFVTGAAYPIDGGYTAV